MAGLLLKLYRRKCEEDYIGEIVVKGLGNILKQAQEMQGKMSQLQGELENMTVTGQAGGGMIKVTATGSQKIRDISIEPSVVDPEDVEVLEDLLVAAVNDALRKSQDMTKEQMSKLTGGLSLPGMNLPGM